jgi:hypothetical protein
MIVFKKRKTPAHTNDSHRSLRCHRSWKLPIAPNNTEEKTRPLFLLKDGIMGNALRLQYILFIQANLPSS